MHLLYATGLRLSEVVAAKVEDLQWVEYPSDVQDDEPLEGWVLTVLGKGQKEREVPVPQGVVDELRLYLFERGIGTPSTFGSGEAFLLGKVGEGVGPNGSRAIDVLQGIAATTLYDQIKAFFGRCASELLKDGDQKGASRLAKASTHWSCATRTPVTPSPAACRSRSPSKTSATRRWRRPRSTSRPRRSAA
jgi:integrase